MGEPVPDAARDERYPLVSILIPTYNYVRYVERAVASAVAQTYPNVEIVVSDNCSTDGAWELLNERFAAEPRVRLFRNASNIGLAPNFDRALERARGEYVMWLSSDDWIYPNHVERLAACFAADSALDVVYGNAYFANDDGVVYDIRSMAGQFPVDYVDARDELVENFTTTCPVCLPCMLVKRSALGERGIASEPGDGSQIASDWETVIRLALERKRFAYVASPSVAIRMHADQHSGEQYHGPGQNVLDFAVFVERYLDHPEFVRRMRGREVGVASLLGVLVRDNAMRNGGRSKLDDAQQARILALQEKLLTRAVAYEPARVRDATFSVVMEACAPVPLVMRSLDALMAQQWPAWELVVVDHGPIELESLLRAHPLWNRMSYVRFPTPQAPGAARNLGLRMARGEYVAFLDPGNRFAPDHLSTAAETIERDGAQVTCASVRLVLESSNPSGIVSDVVGAIAPFVGTADDIAQLDIAPAVPLDALVVYRGMFDRIGRFNPSLPVLDDWELAVRQARGTRIVPTRTVTVDLGVRLGLTAMRVGERRALLVRAVDAIYAGHPVDGAKADERRRYRADLAPAIDGAPQQTATTRGLAEFACTLAGRVLAVPGAR